MITVQVVSYVCVWSTQRAKVVLVGYLVWSLQFHVRHIHLKMRNVQYAEQELTQSCLFLKEIIY